MLLPPLSINFIAELQNIIGYEFEIRTMAEDILIRKQGIHEGKRLAIIGDAILKVVLALRWYPTSMSGGK